MTVYYGPTSEMEDYFSERGFPCPSHSNPADFYMDVLSGVIPHSNDPEWDKDDLFEEWMCAFENPDRVSREEAARTLEEVRLADAQTDNMNSESHRKGCCFVGRVCANVYKEMRSVVHHLRSNVRPDQTGRKTPGSLRQTALLFQRSSLQRLRKPFATVLNIFLMFVAGAMIPFLVPGDAVLYKGIPKTLTNGNPRHEAYLRQNVDPIDLIPASMNNIYFFLLMVSCLSVNVYGPERVVFFRETVSELILALQLVS